VAKRAEKRKDGGVANPYRTRPKEPPARLTNPLPLRMTTLAFGFLCVVLGAAISGKDRTKCAFLGTLAGTALLLARQRVC
jgi:hypothetical protein